MYSTDNGPHRNSWPDGGMTPFRSEKNTNWEGAFRIPLLVRWPGKIKAGEVSTGIVQHHDWLPTFLEMAGAPDIVETLKKGYEAIGRTYKNHIDGTSLLGYITGKEKESPRKLFVYISDDGDVLALRYDNWKVVFMEQRCHGTMQVWAEPFTRLRLPKVYNLRTDPYEFADVTSNSYYEWFIYHAYILYGGVGTRRQVRGNVQGVSAGAEAELLHHRRCAGDDVEREQRRLTSSNGWRPRRSPSGHSSRRALSAARVAGALVEAARLGAVAAAFHRAPTSPAIAAGVEKQPTASLTSALADLRATVRCQQFGGRQNDRPDQGVERVPLSIGPAPEEGGTADLEAPVP